MKRSLLSALFLLGMLAVPARANLITNGNFTGCSLSNGSSTSTTCPTSATKGIGPDGDFAVGSVHAGSGDTPYFIQGWSIGSTTSNLNCLVTAATIAAGGAAGKGGNQYLCGNSWTSSDGTPNLQLNSLPGASPVGGNYFMSDADSNYHVALSQSIAALAPKTTYTLTFYQAAAEQTGFQKNFTVDWAVTLGSTNVCNSPNVTVSNGVATGWTQVSCTFTTGSSLTSNTLSFLATQTSGSTPIPPYLFLSGVDLEPGTGTPEPGANGLVLLGLLGFPFIRKVLRKRTTPL